MSSIDPAGCWEAVHISVEIIQRGKYWSDVLVKNDTVCGGVWCRYQLVTEVKVIRLNARDIIELSLAVVFWAEFTSAELNCDFGTAGDVADLLVLELVVHVVVDERVALVWLSFSQPVGAEAVVPVVARVIGARVELALVVWVRAGFVLRSSLGTLHDNSCSSESKELFGHVHYFVVSWNKFFVLLIVIIFWGDSALLYQIIELHQFSHRI